MCKDKHSTRRLKTELACLACEGTGHISGADLGIAGMCSDAGEPDVIPCIECDGTGLDASVPEVLAASSFSAGVRLVPGTAPRAQRAAH